jgi:DNA mismatch endonuclease (patch repair protein)
MGTPVQEIAYSKFMADSLTPSRRSENMRRIRAKNTKPEMIVRRLLHAMGYRYRLHAKELPGKPDVVFRLQKKAIFVHGCFWHQHSVCPDGRLPGSKQEFWIPKLTRNVLRDKKQIEQLEEAGWRVLVVWECQTIDLKELRQGLSRFMAAPDTLVKRLNV